MMQHIAVLCAFYGLAFCGHLLAHVKLKRVPAITAKVKSHKVAAFLTAMGAAMHEGINGFAVHMVVYSGEFFKFH